MGFLGQDMASLRAISGPVWGHVWRVNLEVNLEVNLVNSGPYSEKPHQIPEISLHTAVGRASRLNMTNNEVLGGCWVVPGIAPSSHPPSPIPRVHPPCHPGARYTVYSATAGSAARPNSAVGLKSVGQVSLCA